MFGESVRTLDPNTGLSGVYLFSWALSVYIQEVRKMYTDVYPSHVSRRAFARKFSLEHQRSCGRPTQPYVGLIRVVMLAVHLKQKYYRYFPYFLLHSDPSINGIVFSINIFNIHFGTSLFVWNRHVPLIADINFYNLVLGDAGMHVTLLSVFTLPGFI